MIDLAAFRARCAEKAAAREAAFAECVANAQPQAVASSLAPLEPVGPTIQEPAAPEPEEPEPFVWHTSARGNPWAQYRDWHVVVFPDRGDTDQWVVRVQRGDRRGRHLSQVWPTAEDAQDAVERAPTKRPSARYVAAAFGLSSL